MHAAPCSPNASSYCQIRSFQSGCTGPHVLRPPRMTVKSSVPRVGALGPMFSKRRVFVPSAVDDSILVKERRASLVPSPLKSNALESNSAIATRSCVAGPASEPGLHARVSSWRRGKEWCTMLGSEALWGQARRPPPVVVSRSCFGSATGMPAPLL